MSISARLRSRTSKIALALGTSALLLAGCGGSAADDGQVTLRFAWWGSEARHTLTQQLIDQFEAQNPGVTVVPEYSNFGDYFDRLSTGAASRDLPDVMQMSDPYMYSYIDNGQLTDLAKVSDRLPTDGFVPSSLSVATVDGALYGVPSGLSGFGLFVDPVAFERAGVPIPDDTTWSWDDYVATAATLSKADPAVVGTQFPLDEQMMNVWLRQRGEDYWNADGSDIGFTADTAAAFWEFVVKLRGSGGAGSVEAALESRAASAGIERSPIALGRGAMQLASVNQLGTVQKTAGRDVRVLLFPGEAQARQTGIYAKPGIIYSIASNSDHPEQAAALIDFMTNSPETARIQRFDRGVPANEKILAGLQPELTPTEQAIAEFYTRIEGMDPVPFPHQNVKAGPALPGTYARLTEDVLFNRLTPRQAGDQFVAELRSYL